MKSPVNEQSQTHPMPDADEGACAGYAFVDERYNEKNNNAVGSFGIALKRKAGCDDPTCA